MGQGRDLDKFQKVQAENSKRAKKNYERKLKRLRYKEELKRLENKKKTEIQIGEKTNEDNKDISND